MGHLDTSLVFSQLHSASVLFERFYTPFLCGIGFIGNCLSISVFCFDSHYRSQSATYYLSALALTDTGYLINLFAIWLESVRELVITSDFVCPLVMYLGQVTCFLSVYLIVAFSAERYVAVHYPLARLRICTRSKARKIIGVLTVVALVLFSYTLVIAKVVELPLEDGNEEFGGGYRCSVPEEYYKISEITNYLDTIITLILPFIMIGFFNVSIAKSLWKIKDFRRELVATTNSWKSKASHTPSDSMANTEPKTIEVASASVNRALPPTGSNGNRECERAVDMIELSEGPFPSAGDNGDKLQPNVTTSIISASTSEERVTKTLLLVSTVFLLLNAPLHIIRIVQFVQTLSTSNETYNTTQLAVTVTEEEPSVLDGESDSHHLFLHTIIIWANMLFNTNFAVNFLLYCANGRNFRKSLRELMACHILRRNQSFQNTSSTYFYHHANSSRRHTGPRRVVPPLDQP